MPGTAGWYVDGTDTAYGVLPGYPNQYPPPNQYNDPAQKYKQQYGTPGPQNPYSGGSAMLCAYAYLDTRASTAYPGTCAGTDVGVVWYHPQY